MTLQDDIFKSSEKSEKLSKLQNIIFDLGSLEPSGFEAMQKSMKVKEDALEEYWDLCEADESVAGLMQHYDLSRKDLNDVYLKMIDVKIGQWVKGHFVALSALAYREPFYYLMESEERGRWDGEDFKEVAVDILRYFREEIPQGELYERYESSGSSSVKMEDSYPFCGFCGQQNKPKFSFCTACGKSLEKDSKAPTESGDIQGKAYNINLEPANNEDTSPASEKKNKKREQLDRFVVELEKQQALDKERPKPNRPHHKNVSDLNNDINAPSADEKTYEEGKVNPEISIFFIAAKGAIFLTIVLALLNIIVFLAVAGNEINFPSLQEQLGDDFAKQFTAKQLREKIGRGSILLFLGAVFGLISGLVTYWNISSEFSNRLVWALVGSFYLTIAYGVAGFSFGFSFGGGWLGAGLGAGLGWWQGSCAYQTRNKILKISKEKIVTSGKNIGINLLSSSIKKVILIVLVFLLAYSNWQLIYSGDVFNVSPFLIPFKVIDNMFTALNDIISFIFG
jgi:hypothetical protein